MKKRRKKKGCPCKSCPKKNSASEPSTQSSPTKCPCENCPKKNTKGCPFMRGLLNRTQDPIAAVATEFLKALKNALNGTNSSRNINIVVAIAGAGGNVQINSADGNVTSSGNASVKVIKIGQSQEANVSNEVTETEVESAELTTVSQSLSENTVELTVVPNAAESVVSSTVTSQETTSAEEPESEETTTEGAQPVLTTTAQESPAVEENTVSA